ncbi:hypothetical protein [Streptomyces sp. NPDC054797]
MTSPQTHLAIDGYVDAIPAPGTSWGTATFDLIHAPADADRIAPDTPDTVYACSTADPRIADVLLREIQPGDLLRVTGTLVTPAAEGAPARLAIDALEVLDAAPAPVTGNPGYWKLRNSRTCSVWGLGARVLGRTVAGSG